MAEQDDGVSLSETSQTVGAKNESSRSDLGKIPNDSIRKEKENLQIKREADEGDNGRGADEGDNDRKDKTNLAEIFENSENAFTEDKKESNICTAKKMIEQDGSLDVAMDDTTLDPLNQINEDKAKANSDCTDGEKQMDPPATCFPDAKPVENFRTSMIYRRSEPDAKDSSTDNDSDSESDSSDSVTSSSSTTSESLRDIEKRSSKKLVDVQQKNGTKGELFPEDLPAIEELQITVDENVVIKLVGKVSAIVGVLVVVQQVEKDVSPLDDGTILFLGNRVIFGQVFEVFGPVSSPFYSVRFNSLECIKEKNIEVGNAVFYAPREKQLTNYVFVEALTNIKGSDASWEHNNEPPEKYVDYSDDEKERRSKLKKRQKNKNLKNKQNGDEHTGHKWQKRIEKNEDCCQTENVTSSKQQSERQQFYTHDYQGSVPVGAHQARLTSWPPSSSSATTYSPRPFLGNGFPPRNCFAASNQQPNMAGENVKWSRPFAPDCFASPPRMLPAHVPRFPLEPRMGSVWGSSSTNWDPRPFYQLPIDPPQAVDLRLMNNHGQRQQITSSSQQVDSQLMCQTPPLPVGSQNNPIKNDRCCEEFSSRQCSEFSGENVNTWPSWDFNNKNTNSGGFAMRPPNPRPQDDISKVQPSQWTLPPDQPTTANRDGNDMGSCSQSFSHSSNPPQWSQHQMPPTRQSSSTSLSGYPEAHYITHLPQWSPFQHTACNEPSAMGSSFSSSQMNPESSFSNNLTHPGSRWSHQTLATTFESGPFFNSQQPGNTISDPTSFQHSPCPNTSKAGPQRHVSVPGCLTPPVHSKIHQ